MAGNRSIGSIYAELAVRDMMSKGLATAKTSIISFGQSAAKWGGIAAAALTGAMVIGTKRVLDQVDSLGDLSTSTGVAVSDLMALRLAYKEGGLSADKAAADINKMQKAISDAAENGDKNGVFRSIGLDIQKLLAMDPASQFEVIGNAIMGVDNMAKRVASARDIFGKSGGGLLAVFGNVEETRRSLGQMPEIAERFADQFGRANDLIGRLPNKSDQFFTGFASGVVGEILPKLEMVDQYDFTDLGQNLGSSLGRVLAEIDENEMQSLLDSIKGFLDVTISVADKFAAIAKYAAIASDFLLPDKKQLSVSPQEGDWQWQDILNRDASERMGPTKPEATKTPAQIAFENFESEYDKRQKLLASAKFGVPSMIAEQEGVAPPDYLLRDMSKEQETKQMPDFQREQERDEFIKRGLVVGNMTTNPKTKIEEKQAQLLEDIKNAILRPNRPTTEPVF